MNDSLSVSSTDLFHGDSAMSALMRAHDWSASPLGEPATWPGPLKTVVSIMLGSNQPMFAAWGPERIVLYNDGYSTLLGLRHPEALGKRFDDIWFDIIDKVGPIMDAAYAGTSTHMDDIMFVMHRNGYPETTHFSFSYTPVQDEAGRIAGMFCVCNETTKIVQANARHNAEQERLRRMFQQAPSFMAMLSGPTHVYSFANDSYIRLVGNRDIIGKTVLGALPELEGQGFQEMLDEVYATGKPFIGQGIPARLKQEDGTTEERYLNFIYQPVVDNAGQISGIFVEGSDVTERILGEQRQDLLIHELNHRVKNILATVQAIANQTFKGEQDHSSARQAFEGRLFALATAHDVLTRTNWEGAEMREVVCEVIDPYLRLAGERFRIEGPRVRLQPNTALALAMAIHELATNAAKYGALSVPTGQVGIVWDVPGDDPHRLLFSWREHGGPVVVPPSRKGFGTRLLERSLAQEEGEVQMSYDPKGVVCTVKTPLGADDRFGQLQPAH